MQAIVCAGLLYYAGCSWHRGAIGCWSNLGAPLCSDTVVSRRCCNMSCDQSCFVLAGVLRVGHLKKCIRLAVIRWSRGISAILLDGMLGAPTPKRSILCLITGDLAVQVLCQTYKVGEEKIPDMLARHYRDPGGKDRFTGCKKKLKDSANLVSTGCWLCFHMCI